MGARPVALLDGLRFGADDFSFDRAVGGIGHYGNCVGVPTVGGEAVFDPAYRHNPLVNAMCVGLLPADRVTRAGATGPGNLVVLYGATTGRDGIGGASVLASQELSDEDEDKRPSVQIGDPFTGKKLIEASLELIEGGLVESLQDLGAAGLASSLAEMAAPWRRRPRRPPRPSAAPRADLEPVEIMLSESQERMVAVVAAAQARGGRGGLQEVGARRARSSARSPTRASCARSSTRRRSARSPSRLLTEETPALHASRPRRASLRRRSITSRRGSAATSCSRCSRRRTSAAAGRSTSATTTSSARGRCVARGWTRRSSACGPHAAGSPSRSTGRAGRRLLDPRAAGARAVLRGRPQRRLRGRAAAGRHRLPQLRQPREARDRVGARRGDRGHGARVRGARHPGRLGQRLALQRDGRARDPPDAGRRLRRARRRRARGAGRLARRRRGAPRRRRRRSRSTGPSTRRSSSAAPPAARPRPTTSPRRRSSTSSGARRRGSVPRTTSPTEASRSRWPSWRSIPASARTSSSSADALAWFGEGAGQAVVACSAERADALEGVPLRRLGTVGGDKLLGVPLAELRSAYDGDGR